MRFGKMMALVAAMAGSSIANQARAITYLNLQADPAQTPISSIQIRDVYDLLAGQTLFPVNIGHWVSDVVIDPRYRISGIYSVKTTQSDSLSMRLFKFKAPLSERFTFISFDFAPGTFASIGTFPSIGDLSAQTTITWEAGARVPEPTTWALMIFGFGATGLALRQRRRAARIMATA